MIRQRKGNWTVGDKYICAKPIPDMATKSIKSLNNNSYQTYKMCASVLLYNYLF